MNKTIFTPIAVLFGLIGAMVLMAQTNMFDPLVKFVHSKAITPGGTLACLGFTILGFAVCYYLLNTLCTYFVPRMKSIRDKDHHGVHPQNKHTNLCVK